MTSVATEITVNDAKCSGSTLANTFNDYLVNIVNHNTNKCVEPNLTHVNLRESLFLSSTTENEEITTFVNLSNSKCRDADGLQIKSVTFAIHLLSRILTHIFDIFLNTCILPQQIQIAIVIVLQNGGGVNKLSNYRPISALPVFSKGLEKTVHSRRTSCLDKYDLLSISQFGFRMKRSTELALLSKKYS